MPDEESGTELRRDDAEPGQLGLVLGVPDGLTLPHALQDVHREESEHGNGRDPGDGEEHHRLGDRLGTARPRVMRAATPAVQIRPDAHSSISVTAAVAAFVASVPFLKLLNRPGATKPQRFLSHLVDGAAKPVGGDSEGTVRWAPARGRTRTSRVRRSSTKRRK